MKTKVILIIICILCVCSCIEIKRTPNRWYSVSEQQKKFKINEINNYDEILKKTSKPKIYKLDSITVINLIKNCNKKYFALFTYNFWAENNQQDLLKTVIDKYDNDSIYLALLSTDDWTQIEATENYLKQLRYTNNSYMLDIKKYGISLNPNRKVLSFIKQMGNNEMEVGWHVLIIFNGNGELVQVKQI